MNLQALTGRLNIDQFTANGYNLVGKLEWHCAYHYIWVLAQSGNKDKWA